MCSAHPEVKNVRVMKERQYWNCTVPATILCQFFRSTDMENYEENSGFRNAWSKVISYAKKYICTICVYVFFRESTGELENFCFYCLLWFLIKVLYKKKITNTNLEYRKTYVERK